MAVAGETTPYQGVRVYFSDAAALNEFAKHALLLDANVTIKKDDTSVTVPVCGILDEAASIGPSVSGGNN